MRPWGAQASFFLNCSIICINLSFIWDHCQATDSNCCKCIQKIKKIKIMAIFVSLGPFEAPTWACGAPAALFMDCFIICINLSFIWDHFQATNSICLKCIQENGKIKIIAISASLGPFGPLNKPVGAPESFFSYCSIIWIDETIARPLTQIVANVLKKSVKSRL